MFLVMDHTAPDLFGSDVMVNLARITNAAADLHRLAHDPRWALPADVTRVLDRVALTVSVAVDQLVAPTPLQDRTDDLQAYRQALVEADT